MAGDSTICSCFAALSLRLRPAVLQFGELRPPHVLYGRVGLAILKSQRVEARCDLNCGHKPKVLFPHGNRLRFRCGLEAPSCR